jgi:hypothetical protein
MSTEQIAPAIQQRLRPAMPPADCRAAFAGTP